MNYMSFKDKLQQIELWRRQIEERGALPGEVLKKVNYKFRLEWNYYSNSMEGNSLTRQETRSVMVGNITVEGKPIKDVLEMKGHDDVIASILKMGKGELNISEKRIKEIHKGIMHEEDPEKAKLIGQWKTAPNHLYNYKNERFDFVAPAEVPERMHQLINWVNAQKEKIQRGDKDALNPVEVAFRFHLDYTTIHPFYDGNGRSARVLTNLILIAYGYPPIYIKTEEKSIYYQYLADIQGYGGEPDLFYDFMAGLLIRSMQLVVDALDGKDIAGPDDWEKKLLLLKQELRTEDGQQIARSADTLRNVVDGSVMPLIERAVSKFQTFNELFNQTVMVLINSAGETTVYNLNQVRHKLTELVEADQLYYLSFTYSLLGFRQNETHSTQVHLLWSFKQFEYVTSISERGNVGIADPIHKLYNESYSLAEIERLINACANTLLAHIENMLKYK